MKIRHTLLVAAASVTLGLTAAVAHPARGEHVYDCQQDPFLCGGDDICPMPCDKHDCYSAECGWLWYPGEHKQCVSCPFPF